MPSMMRICAIHKMGTYMICLNIAENMKMLSKKLSMRSDFALVVFYVQNNEFIIKIFKIN